MRSALILAGAALLVAPQVGLAQKKVVPPTPEKPPVATPAPVAPYDVHVARRITAADVKLRLDAGEKITVIDTRSKFTGVMAKGALNLTDDKLAEWSKDLPKDTFIVAYCT
jgi:hypothetical protein